MKSSTLAFGIALALSGSVLAQNTNVSASGQSNTSVSASRDSASASHESSAAASASSGHGSANVADGTEMNATLSKPVDARHAKAGDEVTATLAQDAKGSGDFTMRRGTKLIGHVTEAQPRGKASGSASGDSRLGIVFDKAILADGREVPVNAAIQAVAAGEAAKSGGLHGADSTAGAGAFGAGQAAGGARAGGGGLVGGVAGSAGGALNGAAGIGGRIGGAATSSVGAATHASAGAVGGVNNAGHLMSGSRGVFGMSDTAFAQGAAGAGSAQGSVLTSHTGNVELQRGTQMLLMSQAAGNAQGATRVATGGASAAGSAAGSADSATTIRR